MIYLIEPYNAHQKPPRKKHWTEIAEEEALLVKMQLENQRLEEAHRKATSEDMVRQIMDLREAQVKSSLNNQNLALPQYAPQPAAQQVQDGQYAAPAGGGGWVPPFAAESTEVADFQLVPESGVGQLLVSFVNLTPTPGDDTFFWDFGTGSLTSTAASPPAITYTQTGSYTVRLYSLSATGNPSTASKVLTVSDPTIFAWISSPLLTSGVAPVSRTYTISNSGTAPNNTVTGWFDFGDGTAKLPYTASGMNSMTFTHIYPTGSFTASLALTESSYNHKSSAQVYVSASVPVLAVSYFAINPESGVGPLYTAMSASHTYNGQGAVTGWVNFGDGTSQSYQDMGGTVVHYYDTGSGGAWWTASIALTESSYNIRATGSKDYVSASLPTIYITGTATSGSAVGETMVTFSYTIFDNGPSSSTWYWDYGNGSSSFNVDSPEYVYYNTGTYTASLAATQSAYMTSADWVVYISQSVP